MMPQLPVVVPLLLALLLPVGGEKKTAVAGCWADGRTDILVQVDDCPPALPPLAELPLWLSWYDPALCWENGRVIENINCDVDPTTLAGGTAVTPEIYGVAGACLPSWFDQTLRIKNIGDRRCLDTGGAIVPTYREVYDPQQGFITLWVIPFDALEHHTSPPWWQFLLVAPDAWEIAP